MANRHLFEQIKLLVGAKLPATDTINEERAPAYAFTPRQALAQYAATGCLNSTFYASAGEQLERVLALGRSIEPEFIARTAVFARERGSMKDLPALLSAILAARDLELLERVFTRVIDNGRMLRNFVQILRSGATGRKSFGTAPKRMIRKWLESRSDERIFADSVGESPSLADIVRMVHPKPQTAGRAALYGYLIGREYDSQALPQAVRRFEAFKAGERDVLPDVPFQMLTSLGLGRREWVEIARRASWQMTRMNLNAFARHGVFDEPGMAELVAQRLGDPRQIARARIFPYQLMVAHTQADARVPAVVRAALEEAMEVAIGNVPKIDGKVYVFPDVSGSMLSPVTGRRRGVTTSVRCLDVAALVAASVLRRNPSAEVIPFSDDAIKIGLDANDSVLTNAAKLAALPSGGTNCSAPIALLNRRRAKGDLLIFVSDNQSWVDAAGCGSATATMREWAIFKARNPQARMVCLDLQPYATTQAKESEEILNIGGFSDQVFELISEFAAGRLNPDHWVGVIEAIEL